MQEWVRARSPQSESLSKAGRAPGSVVMPRQEPAGWGSGEEGGRARSRCPGCLQGTAGTLAKEMTLSREASLQGSRPWGGINQGGLPEGSGPCVGPDGMEREMVGLPGWRGNLLRCRRARGMGSGTGLPGAKLAGGAWAR